MNAEYLAQLGKLMDEIHILSQTHTTRLDRIIQDTEAGLTQAESIEEQLEEFEARKSQIEAKILKHNKI